MIYTPSTSKSLALSIDDIIANTIFLQNYFLHAFALGNYNLLYQVYSKKTDALHVSLKVIYKKIYQP